MPLVRHVPRQRRSDPPLRVALAAAGLPKPATIAESGGDNRDAKKNWAQRFSNALALIVADSLRPKYKNARVTPYEDGRGQEFSVGGKVDRKRTDVGVWDDAAGLVAGVSIKTYTFRDTHMPEKGGVRYEGRYIRNVKRNAGRARNSDRAPALQRRNGVFRPTEAPKSLGPVEAVGASPVRILRSLPDVICEQHRCRVLCPTRHQDDPLTTLCDAEATAVDQPIRPAVGP